MLYSTKDELSRRKCSARFNWLMEHALLIDLTDASKRTTKQNNYLHSIIGAVALFVGESLEYVKQEIYKREVNGDIYVTEHDNPVLGHIETIRSSKELNKEEMSVSIDRFRKWAAEQGIYTPSPGDYEIIAKINEEISHAQYL